ncbi:MAG: UPF0280 family protein [Deltaproteobacteria bacterium]|nr:UPF0280 family protein [Deltaproteobacteria bacterium]
MLYEHRTYRDYSASEGLKSFTVAVKETDLFISAQRNLEKKALDAAVQARYILETYILKRPEFQTSLVPIADDEFAPPLVQAMLQAAAACNVGPMAAVAGAVADFVGAELLKHSGEVIVENGGDIFFKISRPITVGIFAGASPLSERIGIKIEAEDTPFGICTSSGTVGPSLSFGKADAVTIRACTAALADAAASAVGNAVQNADDIQKALDLGQSLGCIGGMVIIKGDKLGVWGNMELAGI